MDNIIPQVKRDDRSRAQAAVEFALILPIALLMVFMIIEIARMAQAWLVVTNSARVGLRYAVTGTYDPAYCTPLIDINGNDLICNQEPDKDIRNDEIDAARLLTIYDVTEKAAVGILKDLAVTEKKVPGYFHVTVCSTNREPEPDGEIRVYHPPPDDYCSPFDHPGDPTLRPARALVAVTFEHQVILPFLNKIVPSVTLHAERTGIVEQFRVARVLGLPPMIEVPSVTPLPTMTATITETPVPTPTPSCDDLYIDRVRFNNRAFRIRVANDYEAPAYLIQSQTIWPGPAVPPPDIEDEPYLDYLQFGLQRYFETDVYYSPLTVSVGTPDSDLPSTLPSHDKFYWESNFNDDLLFGQYCGLLTFEYLDGPVCSVNGCKELIEPTLTDTPNPDWTLTPTWTSTSTSTSTQTATITLTPVDTPTPSNTPTSSNTPPASSTPTITPFQEATETPTKTPWPTLPGGG